MHNFYSNHPTSWYERRERERVFILRSSVKAITKSRKMKNLIEMFAWALSYLVLYWHCTMQYVYMTTQWKYNYDIIMICGICSLFNVSLTSTRDFFKLFFLKCKNVIISRMFCSHYKDITYAAIIDQLSRRWNNAWAFMLFFSFSIV